MESGVSFRAESQLTPQFLNVSVFQILSHKRPDRASGSGSSTKVHSALVHTN